MLGGCASETDQSAPAEPAGSEKQPRRPAPVQDSGTQLVEVPDVTGMDGQDAVDAIEAEELTASYDEADPAGCTVDDQDETGEVRAGHRSDPDARLPPDWENREGDDWDSFTASFAVGAGEGCEALFSLSPDGSLYGGDTEYTAAILRPPTTRSRRRSRSRRTSPTTRKPWGAAWVWTTDAMRSSRPSWSTSCPTARTASQPTTA